MLIQQQISDILDEVGGKSVMVICIGLHYKSYAENLLKALQYLHKKVILFCFEDAGKIGGVCTKIVSNYDFLVVFTDNSSDAKLVIPS